MREAAWESGGRRARARRDAPEGPGSAGGENFLLCRPLSQGRVQGFSGKDASQMRRIHIHNVPAAVTSRFFEHAGGRVSSAQGGSRNRLSSAAEEEDVLGKSWGFSVFGVYGKSIHAA